MKFHLKRSWVGERRFVLWKLAFIALCKFSPFWLRFSSFWDNFFKYLLIWLITSWQAGILGWVSDKYLYLLKPCCNYIFQVPILSISMKVRERNYDLWAFLKSHYLCFENLRKNQILIYPRTTNVLFCKEWKFSNLSCHWNHDFQQICSKISFYLIIASLYLIRSK